MKFETVKPLEIIENSNEFQAIDLVNRTNLLNYYYERPNFIQYFNHFRVWILVMFQAWWQ